MNHVARALLSIAIGILVIIFRKRLLQDTAGFQKDVFKFRYGGRETKIAQFVILIAGAFAIIFWGAHMGRYCAYKIRTCYMGLQ